mmetsp:Transcript_4701/g.10246  ORF Transcript_4701/g.10246 Transcript_4701/m.10246 type:complete len:257 (+) Transcript_4701:453-1223(+)
MRVLGSVAETCEEAARAARGEERADGLQQLELEGARGVAQLVTQRTERGGVAGGEDGARRQAEVRARVLGDLEEVAARPVDARGPEQAARREEHHLIASCLEVTEEFTDAGVNHRQVECLPNMAGDVVRRDGPVDVEDDDLGVALPHVAKGLHVEGPVGHPIEQLVTPISEHTGLEELVEQGLWGDIRGCRRIRAGRRGEVSRREWCVDAHTQGRYALAVHLHINVDRCILLSTRRLERRIDEDGEPLRGGGCLCG